MVIMNSKKLIVKVVCYYIHDIIRITGFDNILIDKKLHEDVLICNTSFKTLIGAKPLHIRLNQ